MDRKQNLSFSMLNTTSQTLAQYPTITATLPAYASIYTLFLANIPLLQQLNEQLVVKNYVFGAKSDSRKDMINKAYDVKVKIVAYATVTENKTLLKEVSICKSDFIYCSANTARDLAQVIYNKATTNLLALANYGITPAVLTALKTAIDTFNAIIPSTKLKRMDKQELIKTRDKLYAECYGYLKKIDALVEMLRNTQPTFYNQYKHARRIEYGTKHMALIGKVYDAESNETLKGVSATILVEETTAFNTKSAEKGGFRIKTLPPGKYTIKTAKPGYTETDTTVYICDGERTYVSIPLRRAG